MAPVIAIPYLSRILTIQPPGLKTDGLVEILTTRVGSRAATDTWSYPDYADLRDANTGMALVGWTFGQSEVHKDSGTRRRLGQPRPCAPRRVGRADGGHANGVGSSDAVGSSQHRHDREHFVVKPKERQRRVVARYYGFLQPLRRRVAVSLSDDGTLGQGNWRNG
jgi:hypothetical protein